MKSGMFVLFAIIAALSGGLQGCGDDDTCADCSCAPSLCDGGDGGGDADADSDGDVPVERCAELQVNSTPEGARIELDGEPTGQVTSHAFVNLPVGLHTFLLTLDGYDAAPAEVIVTTECVPVNITLYPSVEGDWNLTFHNPTTGGDSSFTWNLTQTGETVTGSFSSCSGNGNVTAEGALRYFSPGDDCGGVASTLDGSLINPNRMEGTWESTGGGAGTWWADRR